MHGQLWLSVAVRFTHLQQPQGYHGPLASRGHHVLCWRSDISQHQFSWQSVHIRLQFRSINWLTSRKYPEASRATISYDYVGNRTLMADTSDGTLPRYVHPSLLHTGRCAPTEAAATIRAEAHPRQGLYSFGANHGHGKSENDSGADTLPLESGRQVAAGHCPYCHLGSPARALDAGGETGFRRLIREV